VFALSGSPPYQRLEKAVSAQQFTSARAVGILVCLCQRAVSCVFASGEFPVFFAIGGRFPVFCQRAVSCVFASGEFLVFLVGDGQFPVFFIEAGNSLCFSP